LLAIVEANMRYLLVISTTASLAAAICSHGTTLFPRDGNALQVAKFNYDGNTGPLNWLELNPAVNSACSIGKNQSPINVDTTALKPASGSTLNFKLTPVTTGALFENLGSTLEVTTNGSMTLGGKAFSLKQFHFHTPSEHRIDGEHYPMEVHFVFQANSE
jgi:carbonic anhydrase